MNTFQKDRNVNRGRAKQILFGQTVIDHRARTNNYGMQKVETGRCVHYAASKKKRIGKHLQKVHYPILRHIQIKGKV